MAAESEIRKVAAQRYWREEQARVVVAAWKGSGKSLSAFARRHGIERRRLERWARRLDEAVESVRFHRVQLVGRRPVAAEAQGVGSAIEIEWSPGRRVRVFPGFAAEDLCRVLEVVEKC